MNYHSDEWINKQILRHYNEAIKLYLKDNIIGVFCQGSQNYGLDYEGSDIDTKLILTPNFKDIALNNKPISTTNILNNNEHLDAKDIRLYCQCFKKQNLNFLEILFTDYFAVNPIYASEWNRLLDNREDIAHMNPYRAVKSMKGIALEKYYAMEHNYPSKVDIIKAYGYDGKQVSHLIRVYDYLRRYISGEKYESCLRPSEELIPRIMDYKRLNIIPLDEARAEANYYLDMIKIADSFCANHVDQEDPQMRVLLEDVSYQIMKISVERELKA
jgi:hypothetical protein